MPCNLWTRLVYCKVYGVSCLRLTATSHRGAKLLRRVCSVKNHERASDSGRCQKQLDILVAITSKYPNCIAMPQAYVEKGFSSNRAAILKVHVSKSDVLPWHNNCSSLTTLLSLFFNQLLWSFVPKRGTCRALDDRELWCWRDWRAGFVWLRRDWLGMSWEWRCWMESCDKELRFINRPSRSQTRHKKWMSHGCTRNRRHIRPLNRMVDQKLLNEDDIPKYWWIILPRPFTRSRVEQ